VGDEPVVARAVHGRGEAQAHGVDPAVDELESEVLTATARRLRAVERRRVGLGGRPSLSQGGDAGSDQERAARAGEDVADGLGRVPFGRVRGGHVRPVVLVGQVDDGLGVVRAGPDAVEVVEVAAADPGTLRLDGSGGRIGPGQAGDLVTCREQFVDHGGTDPTGGSGDEDAHDVVSLLHDVDVSHRRQ